MAVIEQPAKRFVASLFYCLCCHWFTVGCTERPREIAQEETSLVSNLCLKFIPTNNSWDQDSIILSE